MTDQPDIVVVVERRRLLSLAYRMTGTLADAEDIVQEAYVRWYRLSAQEREQIVNPPAWFTRTASRLALDLLGSARHRRERYVGQWLPEPVPAALFSGTASAISGADRDRDDPLDRVTVDDAVSTALLLVLEAMTPAERVAFVLHDVFGVPFDEIAETVGKSSAAVRQLAATGRRHVRESRTKTVARAEHDAAVRAFRDAAVGGDLEELMRVLAPDATVRADGGGHVSAAPKAVSGAENVARYLFGLGAKLPDLQSDEVRMGDGLGLALRTGDQPGGVMSFHVEDGVITDIWVMLNPEKLTAWTGGPSRGEGR